MATDRAQDIAGNDPGKPLEREDLERAHAAALRHAKRNGAGDAAGDVAGDVVSKMLAEHLGKPVGSVEALATHYAGIAVLRLRDERQRAAKSADPADRPRGGRARERRFRAGETDALRAAVRERCLSEFRGVFGRDWSEDLARHVDPTADLHGDEHEAREVYEDLRRAMRRAAEFAGREIEGVFPRGRCHSFLRWWVPQFIAPLLKHASMCVDDPKEWGEMESSPRQRFVHVWDHYDVMRLPRDEHDRCRFLDARELAIVWLLGGGWPEGLSFPRKGLKVGDVIALERKNMDRALAGWGQREQFPIWDEERPDLGGSLKRGRS